MAMLCPSEAFAESSYNDGHSSADPLPIDGSVSGALSTSEDIDYYCFYVPEDGVVILHFSTPLQSDSDDLWKIRVEDDGSKQLMTKNISGGSPLVTFPSFGLKKGLHYVVVKAGETAKWNQNEYTLSLNYMQKTDWEREYNDTRNHAWETEYDVVYQGVIMSRNDVDWYKFQYIANDFADIVFSHPAGSPSASCWKLEIIDGQNDTVYRKTVAENAPETRISLNQLGLEDGSYYYLVLSAGSTHSDVVYTLSLSKPHQCDKVYVEAKASTCKEMGHIAHYGCKKDACGKCYDENGVELQSVALPLAEHTWGAWETLTSATCTSSETKKRACSVCQKEEFETVGAVGHSFNSQSRVERKEATCTQKGEIRTYCAASGCEVYQTEEIPEKGHDYSSDWITDVAATCTQAGWESRHCSRCNSKIDGRSIPIVPHPFGVWRMTEFPTCTLMGEEQRTCQTCNVYEVRGVSALGHDYEKDFTVDRLATCTEEGEKSRHCTRCASKTEITALPKLEHTYDQYGYDGDGHWKICACGRKGSIEEHDLTYTLIVTPTCMQSGVGSRHCSVCQGQWDEELPLSEKYHNYTDWRVTAEPSCTSVGEKKRNCELCQVTQIQTLAKLKHQYQNEWTEDVAPSCTQDGSRSHHCKNCSARVDQEVIPATGHTYGAWTVGTHPSCEEKGVERRVCRDCSDIQTREIDAKGHDFELFLTADRESTCDGTGEKSRHCSRCSARTEITVLPALGHRFGDWGFATASTCMEYGTERRTCSACGHVETRRTDDPLGHVFGEWAFASSPTCTESGTEKRICSVCSHVEIRVTDAALGHRFNDWSFATAPSCTESETEKRMCSVCSVSETRKTNEALGHTFGNWTAVRNPTCTERGAEAHTCTVCSHTETRETDALGHAFESDFTVDSEVTCKGEGEKSRHCVRCEAKCDSTVLPALGHSYGTWATVHRSTCTIGETERRACSRCTHEETRENAPALGHAYDSLFTVDIKPTCITAGSQSRHCSRCDERTEITEIAAVGHTYGEGVVVAASTAEEVGVKRFTCLRCEHFYTETVAKLPPSMLDSQEVVWKGSAKSTPAFRSAAALSDFVEVRVNGEVIGSDCYVLREGSTVVELTHDYLKGLKGGAYTLEIVSTTGVAAAEFTVKNGIPLLWLWILVGALSVLAMGVTVWLLMKKNLSKKSEKRTSVLDLNESADQILPENQEAIFEMTSDSSEQ